MGRRSSQIFTDKYGFNLGIQGFRYSRIEGLRDLGIEGLRDLVSIYWSPIRFAQDFCHIQILYWGNSIDKKTERSDTTNLQFSIFNLQFRLVRFGY